MAVLLVLSILNVGLEKEHASEESEYSPLLKTIHHDIPARATLCSKGPNLLSHA
jgi:hypothetical protein